jgi:hypothetical protein
MASMVERLKRLWHRPRDVEEAEWYILFGIFMTLWMCMILW